MPEENLQAQGGNLEETANGQEQTNTNTETQTELNIEELLNNPDIKKQLTSKFNAGFKQANEKLEKSFKDLGFDSLEDFVGAFNELKNSKNDESKEENGLSKETVERLEAVEKELNKYKEEAANLKREKAVGEVTSKLKEEFGYDLPSSFKFEGETVEELEADARTKYEELEEWKKQNNVSTSSNVGSDSKPSTPVTMTRAEFDRLPYTEKVNLYNTNKTLYDQLVNS